MSVDVFESLESRVRSYCRDWPVVFARAEGCRLYDEAGRGYLDFFSGAGALNYGHNHPDLLAPLMEYLSSGALIHSLDMHTPAKRTFLERFRDSVLEPRRPGLQGDVPRADRHQRRRVRTEDRPQGHRTAAHPVLHQRLPRHDARLARR